MFVEIATITAERILTTFTKIIYKLVILEPKARGSQELNVLKLTRSSMLRIKDDEFFYRTKNVRFFLFITHPFLLYHPRLRWDDTKREI